MDCTKRNYFSSFLIQSFLMLHKKDNKKKERAAAESKVLITPIGSFAVFDEDTFTIFGVANLKTEFLLLIKIELVSVSLRFICIDTGSLLTLL